MTNKAKGENAKKEEITASSHPDNEQPSTSTANLTPDEAKDTENVQKSDCADTSNTYPSNAVNDSTASTAAATVDGVQHFASSSTQNDELCEKKPNIENKSAENSSPTSLSNSSGSSGSSPDSTLPVNTSTEHEQSLEKDFERKILRKIEYYLMDIFQHLNENETDTSNTSDNLLTTSQNNELGP